MVFKDNGGFYQTVLAAARTLFDGGLPPRDDREALVHWILLRQNRQKGFIFYPSPQDWQAGIYLFSGERPRTKFLAENAVELETLRLLARLDPGNTEVQRVFRQANQRLFPLCFANSCTQGECAQASLAFLRYITAFDADFYLSRIKKGLERLKEARAGDGQWKGFPFYFTLLWLTEIPAELALAEMAYASTRPPRLVTGSLKPGDAFSQVRKAILRQAVRTVQAARPGGVPALPLANVLGL